MIHRKNLLIYCELGDISDPKVALKQVHLTDCIGGFDFYRVCDNYQAVEMDDKTSGVMAITGI